MGNPFKIMIWGYLIPLLGAVVAVSAPEYDPSYTVWIIAVFVILLLMPIVLVLRFPANKVKAYKLTIIYQWYALLLLFTFPLLKVFKEEIFYQLLLVGLFISIYFLARLDQQTEVQFVFPDRARKNDKAKTCFEIKIKAIHTLLS